MSFRKSILAVALTCSVAASTQAVPVTASAASLQPSATTDLLAYTSPDIAVATPSWDEIWFRKDAVAKPIEIMNRSTQPVVITKVYINGLSDSREWIITVPNQPVIIQPGQINTSITIQPSGQLTEGYHNAAVIVEARYANASADDILIDTYDSEIVRVTVKSDLSVDYRFGALTPEIDRIEFAVQLHTYNLTVANLGNEPFTIRDYQVTHSGQGTIQPDQPTGPLTMQPGDVTQDFGVTLTTDLPQGVQTVTAKFTVEQAGRLYDEEYSFIIESAADMSDGAKYSSDTTPHIEILAVGPTWNDVSDVSKLDYKPMRIANKSNREVTITEAKAAPDLLGNNGQWDIKLSNGPLTLKPGDIDETSILVKPLGGFQKGQNYGEIRLYTKPSGVLEYATAYTSLNADRDIPAAPTESTAPTELTAPTESTTPTPMQEPANNAAQGPNWGIIIAIIAILAALGAAAAVMMPKP